MIDQFCRGSPLEGDGCKWRNGRSQPWRCQHIAAFPLLECATLLSAFPLPAGPREEAAFLLPECPAPLAAIALPALPLWAARLERAAFPQPGLTAMDPLKSLYLARDFAQVSAAGVCYPAVSLSTASWATGGSSFSAARVPCAIGSNSAASLALMGCTTGESSLSAARINSHGPFEVPVLGPRLCARLWGF
ncbi:UNVERIFIED_CONTAM: hypothetical protein FKN15_021198 [Acipenser sinensis]